MQSTYAAAFTLRKPRTKHRSPTSATRLYNDPSSNYDDPALPPPPLVSRLQPVSFTASMAPEGVAYRPVPLVYPQHADPTLTPVDFAAAAAAEKSTQAARFSTTSLESLSRFTGQDASRMGMSGAESFRFTLRDNPQPRTTRPQPLQQPEAQAPTPQPSGTDAFVDGAPLAPTGRLTARQSARLPPSRFFYHYNHTNKMLSDNARYKERGGGHTIVITPVVLPRVAETQVYHPARLTHHHPPPQPHLQQQQQQQWQSATFPLVSAKPAAGVASGGPAALFPYAYNPGQSGSARAHAYDLSGQSAPMGPPIYDSFPLHPQQRFFRPSLTTPAQQQQQHASQWQPFDADPSLPLAPPPAPALALDPRTHRYVPAFSESADRQTNRLALETPSIYD